MKTIKVDNEYEIDFLILGVNCHLKSYKLCWEINKKLNTNFIKTKNHPHPQKEDQNFERFTHTKKNTQTQYNILSNRCDTGYLDPTNKGINYFLLVQGGIYNSKKIIESLNQIEDVLLVFELNLSKINSITPFIIND